MEARGPAQPKRVPSIERQGLKFVACAMKNWSHGTPYSRCARLIGPTLHAGALAGEKTTFDSPPGTRQYPGAMTIKKARTILLSALGRYGLQKQSKIHSLSTLYTVPSF
jgi:hypothetical protein